MPGRRRQRRTERSKLDATPPWELRVRPEPAATKGPFDERDAPDDELARIDLGALRIAVPDDVELRLDVDESQQVVAATLVNESGSVQLGVFAAPRNEGIWDEVRAEIAQSLTQGLPAHNRDAVSEQEGPFGPELHGVLADGAGGWVPVRFVGVDGPRWFLRAMFAGPLAADDTAAAEFEAVLRSVVVVRGNSPLPVREPVPLQLPDGVQLPDPPG